MVNRAAENLALLEVETSRLLATARLLDDEAMAGASLCTGWSRAHVLTHVARNADALLNLVRWAVDGRERPAYSSAEAREAEIAAGALRDRGDILADLEQSADSFATEAQALRGPAGDAQVRSRTGTPVSGAQVVAMRILEVVFHHVDLVVGYGFDDADPQWVGRTLRRGVRQWDERPDRPGLTIHPEGMEPLALGGGGQVVRGTPGGLLLWLARGVEDEVVSEGALPAPPTWA